MYINQEKYKKMRNNPKYHEWLRSNSLDDKFENLCVYEACLNERVGRPAKKGTLLALVHDNNVTTQQLAKHWGKSISQVQRINTAPEQWHWDSVKFYLLKMKQNTGE